MGYHQKFNPGTLFFALVKPYIIHLPQTTADPPLEMEVPRELCGSARFQWYNYFHHVGKGHSIYTIRTRNSINPLVSIFTISLKSAAFGKPKVLSSRLPPEDGQPTSTYTDADFDKAIKEMEKEQEDKTKFEPGKWKRPSEPSEPSEPEE